LISAFFQKSSFGHNWFPETIISATLDGVSEFKLGFVRLTVYYFQTTLRCVLQLILSVMESRHLQRHEMSQDVLD